MFKSISKNIILGCALLTLAAQPIYANSPVSTVQTFGEVGTFGVFNPSHTYLDNGVASISNPSSGTIRITSRTYASDIVSQIGVKLYIDQLVGTNWALVISKTDSYSTQTDEYNGVHDVSVSSGKTYRIRCTFWVKNGDVIEEGKRTYTLSI